MTGEEIAAKLAELEQKCKNMSDRIKEYEQSIGHRLDVVERTQSSIADLAASVKVIALKQDFIAEQTSAIAGKVETLEHAPGKKWGIVIRTALTALVTALITLAVTKLFS